MKNVLHLYFKDKFYKNDFSSKMAKRLIQKSGFSVLEYNPNNPNDLIMEAIDEIGYRMMVEQSDAFTYDKGDYKCVFLRKGLPEEETRELLFHEYAHIYYQHINDHGVVKGIGIYDERKANGLLVKLKVINTLQKVLLILIICSLAILGIAKCFERLDQANNDPDSYIVVQSPTSTTSNKSTTTPKTDEKELTVYWTSAGTVYHLYENCYHLNNSINILSGDTEQSGKDRVCSTCESRRLKEAQ